MTVADHHWQVQEAKQRFSELLRAAEKGDYQFITRHGKEVAVVVDIESFHAKVAPEPPRPTLIQYLLSLPRDDEFADVMEEVVADRSKEVPRMVDLG